jgi:crotonobetainyl-CoA:carnitine CoA-transferase CaiB-like acyl-CoA transferase
VLADWGAEVIKVGSRAVLEKPVRSADVFLTDFLPGPRSRLKIDVEAIRAINPDIIYVRGGCPLALTGIR